MILCFSAKEAEENNFIIAENDNVIKTIEKEEGGDFGIIGIYGFKNTQDYKNAVEKMLEKQMKT